VALPKWARSERSDVASDRWRLHGGGAITWGYIGSDLLVRFLLDRTHYASFEDFLVYDAAELLVGF
jgi:hypothetical protein